MRAGELSRKTKETDIYISLDLDGTGKNEIDTKIGFFDHMLTLFAIHGSFDLTVRCCGDVKVDGHHTVEDIGIVIGKLINTILSDKRGIKRYAHSYIPMDDALVRSVLDLCGRPFLAYKISASGKTGEFDSELCEEFFRAVSSYGLITLHIEQLDGKNTHHILEAVFKSFAYALKEAVTIISDRVLSSKGVLEQ